MEPLRLEIADFAVDRMEAVENALRVVPGVISVRADPAGDGVRVEAVEGIDTDDLLAALRKAGHIATLAG